MPHFIPFDFRINGERVQRCLVAELDLHGPPVNAAGFLPGTIRMAKKQPKPVELENGTFRVEYVFETVP